MERARGQFDEALRIRKQVQMPAYERLGDLRTRALTQAKIGLQILDASDGDAGDDARALLQAAWSDLSRLGLPEAADLASEMRNRGVVLPRA